MFDDKKLKIYIKKELARGVPKWIVRKELLNAGWNENYLGGIFESLEDKKRFKEFLSVPFSFVNEFLTGFKKQFFKAVKKKYLEIILFFGSFFSFKKLESFLVYIFWILAGVFKFILDSLSFLFIAIFKFFKFFMSFIAVSFRNFVYYPLKLFLMAFQRIIFIFLFSAYKLLIYWPLILFYFVFFKFGDVFFGVIFSLAGFLKTVGKKFLKLFVKKELLRQPEKIEVVRKITAKEKIKKYFISVCGAFKSARFWIYKIMIEWPFKIITAVLFEIKEIIKGSFLTIGNGFFWIFLMMKKIVVSQFAYFLKLPVFIAGNYKIFKEYIVNLTERILIFFENIFASVLRLVFSPLSLLGVAFSFVKSKIVFIYKKIFGGKEKVVIIRETAEKPETLEAELSAAEARHETIALVDIIQLATRMFKTRRLRTFLTVLGIGVGIGTILFLVSLGYGLQNLIFEKIATSESLLSLDVIPASEAIQINPQLVSDISKIENVEKVSPLVSLNGQVSSEDIIASSFLYGTNPSYFSLAGLKPAVGQFFTDESDKEIVVSSALIKLLTPENNQKVIGWMVDVSLFLQERQSGEETKTVKLEEKYKIVGIIDEPVVSFVYLPLKNISNLSLPDYSNVKVKVAKNIFLDPVRDQILAKGFLVSAISDTLEQAQKIFGIAQIVLALFGIVALIVSAIGMFNTMTIALLERTQEIGIMKAIGASNMDIWKMFLAESVIMGFLGGLGGIAVGILGSAIFNYGINLLASAFGGESLNLFQRPSWFIITIIVFATAVGFFTGLWPARRAAKLNALDALRYK